MSPTGNGVPTVVVEKILDTMKDVASSMKNTDIKMDQLEESFYKNLEKIAESMTDVGVKFSTPPRHEEIMERLSQVKTSVEEVSKLQKEKTELLTSVIRTIKIGAALFSLSILIGSIFLGVVQITTKSDSFKQVIEMGKIIEKLEKDFSHHNNYIDPSLQKNPKK